MRKRETLPVLLLSLLLCCAKGNVKPNPTGALYDRLGGKNAIEAVVKEFVKNVAADTRINGKFQNADLPGLETKLVDQICAAAGGPCTYTGKDMKTTHLGMGITEAEFNAMVEDLVKALDHFKVAEPEKKDLLALLSPMKGDIVEVPGQ